MSEFIPRFYLGLRQLCCRCSAAILAPPPPWPLRPLSSALCPPSLAGDIALRTGHLHHHVALGLRYGHWTSNARRCDRQEWRGGYGEKDGR